MTENADIIRSLAPSSLLRELTATELELLAIYLSTLLQWQRTQRLVSSGDAGWIQRHLFADALLFDRFVPKAASSLLDLGSGAGLPGVPLKIVRPDLDVVLLEARQKRASFLRSVVRALGMPGLRVDDRRAEDALDLVRTVDVVTCRCAGDIQEILPLGVRFLRASGVLVVAGPPVPREVAGVTWHALEVEGLGSRTIGVVRNT